MVDIDTAMAAIGSSEPAGNSEPVATEPKAEAPQAGTAPATETTKDSGSAGEEPKATEVKETKQAEYEVPKSAYAFARLKDKLRSNQERMDKLTEAIKKYSGITFDPKKDSIESYVEQLFNKRDLEAQQKKIAEDPETDELFDAMRDEQAKDIYGKDSHSIEVYKTHIAPKRRELYANIEKLDKTGAVIEYMQESKLAPLLEAAFLGNDGQKLFDQCVSSDTYMTKRNLDRLEQAMLKSVQAYQAKQQTQPKPVTTPSVNDGTATTHTKTGPSLKDVASWFQP